MAGANHSTDFPALPAVRSRRTAAACTTPLWLKLQSRELEQAAQRARIEVFRDSHRRPRAHHHL
ncbi:MAG: hypothetical protein ACRDQZ_11265, partial [Mycobacteriales bacterium]